MCVRAFTIFFLQCICVGWLVFNSKQKFFSSVVLNFEASSFLLRYRISSHISHFFFKYSCLAVCWFVCLSLESGFVFCVVLFVGWCVCFYLHAPQISRANLRYKNIPPQNLNIFYRGRVHLKMALLC